MAGTVTATAAGAVTAAAVKGPVEAAKILVLKTKLCLVAWIFRTVKLKMTVCAVSCARKKSPR